MSTDRTAELLRRLVAAERDRDAALADGDPEPRLEAELLLLDLRAGLAAIKEGSAIGT